MEIQNSQVGQAFAYSSSASPARANPLPESRLINEGSMPLDQRNKQSMPLASVNAAEASGNVQNLSHVLTSQVDKDLEYGHDAQLQEAIEEVKSFLTAQNRDLAFSIDETTSRSVVTVKDSTSGDIIRQIPSEEVLKLAERIQELQQDVGNSVGVFINNQV